MDAFKGSVVLITGAAAGIGRATAMEFVAQGATVASLDLHECDVEGVQSLIADLQNEDEVSSAVQEFGNAHGRIDILVNNAAVSFVGTVEEGTFQDWTRVLDINVIGYARSTRACLPHLRRSSHAAIVNMSSCSAVTGLTQRALYSASKGAVHSMTTAMAADLLPEGIRVNCVVPGTVDTPFMDELARRDPDPARKRAEFEARQPTGHMLAPEEVAAAVLYLANPKARSTVATVLTVDGGLEKLKTPLRRPAKAGVDAWPTTRD